MRRNLKDIDDPIRNIVWKVEQITGPPYSRENCLFDIKAHMQSDVHVKKFLKYGIHKALYSLYKKCQPESADALIILEIVLEFAKIIRYNHPFSVHGYFCQEGFHVVATNIRLVEEKELAEAQKDKRGNYIEPKMRPVRPYSKSLKLDRILADNIPNLTCWVQILTELMLNPKGAKFAKSQGYLIFWQCFALISKLDEQKHLSPEQQKSLYSAFYDYLTRSLDKKLFEEYILSDADLLNWVFAICQNAKTVQNYVRNYKIFTLLTQYPEFTKYVTNLQIIVDILFNKMIMVCFPNERTSEEKTYFADRNNLIQFCQPLARAFFNISNEKNMPNVILMIKSCQTDILLRFYLAIMEVKDHYSAIYMTFGLSSLLKSDLYKLPSYSSQIGLLIANSVSRQDDFLTILCLRVLKFVEFEQWDKLLLFQILLTPEQIEISQTIQNVNKLVFKTNPIYQKGQELKQVVNPPKSDIQPTDYLETDFTLTLDFEEEERQKEKQRNPEKSLPIYTAPKLLPEDEDRKKRKKKTGFYFKRKLKPEFETPRRFMYPFLNDQGEEFLFIKNSDGCCPFCVYSTGIFSLDNAEFLEFCESKIQKSSVITDHSAIDLTFSIYQIIFDLTLAEEMSFMHDILLPFFCKFLTSIPMRFRFPIVLFLTHLVENIPNGVDLLYEISFFSYGEEMISEFLVNFNLESFKRELRMRKIKAMVPKNRKENAPPEINKKKKDKKASKPEEIKPEFEEVELDALGIVEWNPDRGCFMIQSKPINADFLEDLKRGNEDDLTDDGKFSKYFWNLHFIYHIYRLIEMMVGKSDANQKDYLYNAFTQIIQQIKETTIIFYKYSDKYIPTAPFHEDTECWLEIKSLISELLGVLQELQYILISKYPPLSDNFLTHFDGDMNHLALYVNLISKLPTLDSTIACISSILLYFTVHSEDAELKEMRDNNLLYVSEIFTESVSNEFQRIKPGLEALMKRQEKEDDPFEFLNKKAFTNTLKLGICSLQMLNILNSRKKLNVENLPEEIVANLFQNYSIFMKVAKLVHVANKRKNTVLTDENYAPTGPEKHLSPDGIQEDVDLLKKFNSISGMCIWQFSQHNSTAEAMKKSDIITFMLREITKMDMDQNALFSYFAGFHDILNRTRPLSSLLPYHTTFVEDFTEMVNTMNFDRALLIPILRGLRTSLGMDSHTAYKFRPLIPFLRDLVSNEDGGKEVSSIPQEKKFEDNHSVFLDYLKLNANNPGNPLKEASLSLEKAEQFNFDPNHKKLRSKPKPILVNDQHTPADSMLIREVRGLMRLISIANEYDLQQSIKNLRKPKKRHYFEAAGLMSDQTADLLEKAKEEEALIRKMEEIKRKHDIANFSTLIGNSKPFDMRDPTLTLPHRLLPKVPSDFSSAKPGLHSFNPSRDLDLLIRRSLNLDQNALLKMGSQTSSNKDSKEKLDLMSKEFFGNYKSKLGSHLPNSRSTVFQDSGKNILQMINMEYAKLLK